MAKWLNEITWNVLSLSPDINFLLLAVYVVNCYYLLLTLFISEANILLLIPCLPACEGCESKWFRHHYIFSHLRSRHTVGAGIQDSSSPVPMPGPWLVIWGANPPAPPTTSVAPPTHAWPRPPHRRPEEQLPSSVYCAVTPARVLAMPRNAQVTMRYGPYSSIGLSVEHRTYRLEGLLGRQPAPKGRPTACARVHPSLWTSVQAVPSA